MCWDTVSFSMSMDTVDEKNYRCSIATARPLIFFCSHAFATSCTKITHPAFIARGKVRDVCWGKLVLVCLNIALIVTSLQAFIPDRPHRFRHELCIYLILMLALHSKDVSNNRLVRCFTISGIKNRNSVQ